MPTSKVQSDARPTGVQEIVGSIPAGSGNILSWIIPSLPLIKEGQMSVSGERMGVNRLEETT